MSYTNTKQSHIIASICVSVCPISSTGVIGFVDYHRRLFVGLQYQSIPCLICASLDSAYTLMSSFYYLKDKIVIF